MMAGYGWAGAHGQFQKHGHHHDSNIGSQFITEEESRDARSRLVMDSLRAHFRPEFLNRVDEIIIFDRLREDD